MVNMTVRTYLMSMKVGFCIVVPDSCEKENLFTDNLDVGDTIGISIYRDCELNRERRVGEVKPDPIISRWANLRTMTRMNGDDDLIDSTHNVIYEPFGKDTTPDQDALTIYLFEFHDYDLTNLNKIVTGAT